MSGSPLAQLNEALAGRYSVERELGAGGMATVYLARDLKHDRPVAIKVLANDLSASLGAARFLQEIRIAAQLQHPHILGLIDSGQVDDTVFYVMPFVEGESLRDRLVNGPPLPIAEAVRILREVADGLSHAHAHGIVHRDIKPENVMLSGRHALVVDFGVAKALIDASDRERLTTVGIALGTPTYMAPEQASAEPTIDHRADIYAVGVMAYEMLSGRPPFSGMSHQQVVMAHMTRAPAPLGAAGSAVAPELERVVMRCLEKEPADRFQSADDLFAALEPHATASGEMSAKEASSGAATSRRFRVLAVTGIMIAALAFFIWKNRQPGSADLSIGKSSQLTSDDGLEIQPSISPDGKLVAYAAGNSQRMRIFIRPVAGGRTIALSDDSTSVETQPRWSPDGNQLLFLSRNGAYVSPALGGSEQLVAGGGTGDAAVRSAAWSPNGSDVALVRNDSLLIQPLGGSTQRLAGRGSFLHSCAWSADGVWIACVSGNPFSLVPGYNFGNLAPSAIVLLPAAGGAPVRVTNAEQAHQSPLWSPSERVLYFVSNQDGPRDVYAITIGRDGRATGPPRRVTTGLNTQSISLSSDRMHLAYTVYSAKANIWAVQIPATAPVTTSAAVRITSGSQVIEVLQASRDGKWLLYDSDLKGSSEIYRQSLSGGSAEQITHDSLDKFAPELSPDGRGMVYHAFGADGHRQIYVKNLETNSVQKVSSSKGQLSTPHWSPDGSSIVTWDQSTAAGMVLIVHRNARGEWQHSERRLSAGRLPVWSPDGRTIVFVGADGSVQSVAADSGPVRTLYSPRPTGDDPLAQTVKWSADANVVYIKGRDAAGRGGIWSVAVADGHTRLLVRLDDPLHPSDRPDFSTDGRRLFFTIDDRQSDIWIAELKRP